jgi:deazaflavin-dependent oxidoreductase (nitroreductase family)
MTPSLSQGLRRLGPELQNKTYSRRHKWPVLGVDRSWRSCDTISEAPLYASACRGFFRDLPGHYNRDTGKFGANRVKRNELKDRLPRYRQIKLSVVGRKSGKTISMPVWFVLEGNKLYLLPVSGSETQWYKNVLQNPSIRVDARGTEAEIQAQPVTDAKMVESVIEKFRQKYGKGDVKKYYSKLDVAVVAELG